MALEYPNNVVGFIAQNKLNSKYLTFTPGVNIDVKGDDLGQSYNTPEVLKAQGTDYFIVGRGIYNSENPKEKAKEYVARCN